MWNQIWDSRSEKSAILTYLMALNFNLVLMFASKRLKFIKSTECRASKIAKRDFLNFEPPKLISRKIWMTEKSWNSTLFYTAMLLKPQVFFREIVYQNKTIISCWFFNFCYWTKNRFLNSIFQPNSELLY